MDEYDVVPPAAKPEEVVVNDGLPPEDTSAVEPGTEDDTSTPDPKPEPEPEMKRCDDGTEVEITEDCPVHTGTTTADIIDPCDGQMKPPHEKIPADQCCDGAQCPPETPGAGENGENGENGTISAGCDPGFVNIGGECLSIESQQMNCDPGFVLSSDMINCEMGPEMIAEIEAKAEADRIAAELAAKGPPPSAVPSLQAFNICMEESKLIINEDDPQGALLYPDGNFQDCRFPDGNFQPDWRNTGRKNEDGTPIFEEMWNLSSHGLKPASWYKERGINAPTWDVMKTLSGGTDGTYHWDGKGNITGGPCCEGDTCGGEGYKSGSFRICDSDPNKEARGFVGVGGDPNHYQNVLRSISNSLGAQAFIGGTAGDGLILGYRPPTDMKRKDELLFAYNTLLGQQAKATQAVLDAQAKVTEAKEKAQNAKTEFERKQAEAELAAAEAEKERLAKEAETVYTQPTIAAGVLGTAGGGTTTTTDSPKLVQDISTDMKTITPTAAGGVPAYSLSMGTGIESLAVPADPIDVNQYLFGPTAGGGGGGGSTPPADNNQSGTTFTPTDPWDMFSETTQTNNAPLFQGPQPQPSTNPLMTPIEQRQKDVVNLFGGSQPEFTVHPIQSTAKEAKDLFSGFI